jgi:hypothetical protein
LKSLIDSSNAQIFCWNKYITLPVHDTRLS